MTCFTTTTITLWSWAPINLSPISGYATHAIDLMIWNDAHCIHLNRTVLFTAFYPHLLSVAYLVNRVLFFSCFFRLHFIFHSFFRSVTHSFSRFIFNLVIVSVLTCISRPCNFFQLVKFGVSFYLFAQLISFFSSKFWVKNSGQIYKNFCRT